MKTKLIILTAVAAALLYACSDRDEEVRKEAIESVKNSNQKIKLNKSGIQAREGEVQATSDTIRVRSLDGPLGDNPDTNLDPGNEGDPKDVPPRK
jgi:outer membrane biogenesis lipoprotein LolB